MTIDKGSDKNSSSEDPKGQENEDLNVVTTSLGEQLKRFCNVITSVTVIGFVRHRQKPENDLTFLTVMMRL
jgi:hypothetical protein